MEERNLSVLEIIRALHSRYTFLSDTLLYFNLKFSSTFVLFTNKKCAWKWSIQTIQAMSWYLLYSLTFYWFSKKDPEIFFPSFPKVISMKCEKEVPDWLSILLTLRLLRQFSPSLLYTSRLKHTFWDCNLQREIQNWIFVRLPLFSRNVAVPDKRGRFSRSWSSWDESFNCMGFDINRKPDYMWPHSSLSFQRMES